MFSKFERRNAAVERGNAAVVALCVTTLAVGVVMVVRVFSGGDPVKPVTQIAATNIGAGESDAEGPILASAIQGTVRNSETTAGTPGSDGVGSSPSPTLPGSVPTIPPDGAVPVAAAVPVVEVVVTPTTTPPVILGLKTPQAASRNLFDAWKENDRSRARRFADWGAVDVIFRQPWGAEIQNNGCSKTSDPQAYQCAFVGDVSAWIVVVTQRAGPTGREFVPIRTIVTRTKKESGSYLIPSAGSVSDGSDTRSGTSSDPSASGALTGSTGLDPSVDSGANPSTDPLAIEPPAPLVDPADIADSAGPTIADPSLLDPTGAAAALNEDSGGGTGSATSASGGLAGNSGTGVSTGTKSSIKPSPKAPKKKKAKIRRPKSAVSSSSNTQPDAGATGAGDVGGGAVATEVVKPKKKATVAEEQPAGGASPAASSSGSSGDGGAVKAAAPPVNQVDG